MPFQHTLSSTFLLVLACIIFTIYCQKSVPFSKIFFIKENRPHHDVPTTSDVIIPAKGDDVDYYYVYEPDKLQLPKGADVEHAHGIYIEPDIDRDFKVIITYHDKTNESQCLVEWTDVQETGRFLGPGTKLCAGMPHGLAALKDDGKTFLYHANNDQRLSKTTLNGTIVWTSHAQPPDANATFMPTWFGGQPDSPFLYLADGYGSSRIYLYHRSNGTYAGKYFGGIGSTPGYFKTSHGLSWDWRFGQIIVSDRENHRLQYFAIDHLNESMFEYITEQSFAESHNLYRPCNIRFHPTEQQAIIPFLEGTVAILRKPSHQKPIFQQIESVLNITGHLGNIGFKHPHDVHFLRNGDFVLVTWNPGRIGYFRKVMETKKTAQEKALK